MKNVLIALLICTRIVLCASAQPVNEVWAYLMKGEESYFPAASPITDVACFSAAVNGNGHLEGGHLAPPALPANHLRYHLVVTMPWNPTLAHIYLDPELPFRDRIIADIVQRSKPYDGIQIDFEGVSKEDGTNYLNFLAAVRKVLPKEKLLSVAVMARWAEHKASNPADAYDYAVINLIADRIVVMAYDEHYRGGPAGSIASLPWCKKVYDYAQKTIDPNKLVMGIPLYGRSWQKDKTVHAYRNPEVWTDLRIRQTELTSDPENGGTYSYTTNVTIAVHFETLPSLDAKMELYASKPTRGIAFWRISQEPLNFWDHIAK